MSLEFVPGPGCRNRRVDSASTIHTRALQARCSSSRARCIRQSLDKRNCTAENKGDPSSGDRMTLGQEGSTSVGTSSHAAVPRRRFHLKGRLPKKRRSSSWGSIGLKGHDGTQKSSCSWLKRCPRHLRCSRAANFFCLIRDSDFGLRLDDANKRLQSHTQTATRMSNYFQVTCSSPPPWRHRWR